MRISHNSEKINRGKSSLQFGHYISQQQLQLPQQHQKAIHQHKKSNSHLNMQLTTALAILAAADTSLAAPAPAAAKSMMAAGTTWTIENFQRTCNSGDTSCHISFGVNINDGSAATACSYDVNGSPASDAAYNSLVCGPYTVGSSHDPNGFTVLSVHNSNLIVYPGYTDAELDGGNVVKPDKSYTPSAFPG